MGTSKAIGPGRPIAASLWPNFQVPACPVPSPVRRAEVARRTGLRFRPGHYGPASPVRTVLGRNRVRDRNPNVISLVIHDRIKPIPSAYT